jgi:ppGpp synthetase/RelA/SpoT-type nucleotidyltranferase
MNEEELGKIKEDYLKRIPELNEVGVCNLNILNKIGGVHASNYRIKDPEHLIKKIIRKGKEGRTITIDNYCQEITDLVGIRLLHVFKDGWKDIDTYIRVNYELFEKPKAFRREGDNNSDLEGQEFEMQNRELGYRSLHYVVKSKPAKNEYLVEIQVRTIFEEAWGEIDHTILYPDLIDDEVLKKYTLVLNRLAGLGDEMGIIMREIKGIVDINKKEKEKLETKIIEITEEKDILTKNLIEKVNTSNEEKEKYKQIFNKLQNAIILERDKIKSINHENYKPYYLAEDIINTLRKNGIKIMTPDWNKPAILYARGKRGLIPLHSVCVETETNSLLMLQVVFYENNNYIPAYSSSLENLVSNGYLNLINMDIHYLPNTI